jgi:hypothetical protein
MIYTVGAAVQRQESGPENASTPHIVMRKSSYLAVRTVRRIQKAVAWCHTMRQPRLVWAAHAAVLCVALGFPTRPARSQVSSLRRDSLIFDAVVRSLVTDSAYTTYMHERVGVLRVSPVPPVDRDLSNQAREVPGPTASEIARMRRNALRALGVGVGDATRPENCAGIMTPFSPDAHRGCPRDASLVASIGRARDSTDRHGPSTKTLATTRVAVLEVGPEGFSILSSDWVLEYAGSGWKVVGRRFVSAVE